MENEMKFGDKIKSDKYKLAPKGNVFTVTDVWDGYVCATCDAGSNGLRCDYAWHFSDHEYTPYTPTIGTLQELNVKAGDVVECLYCGDIVYTVGKQYDCPRDGEAYDNLNGIDGNESTCRKTDSNFKIISRASDTETPRTWGELTDAEKGALLLAKHEGKVIQFYFEHWRLAGPKLYDHLIYRVKPEPVVEEHFLRMVDDTTGETYYGTINLIDGVPDVDSVTLTEV